MVQILNVYERAMSLLISQFRDFKPDGSLTNFMKLIKVLADELQELENVNWELKTERWLDSAIGAQLDEIGIILGLPRNPGESDENYRQRLRFQIFINSTSGTPEQLIAILKFLTNAESIIYVERDFAFVEMTTDGLTFPDPPNLLNDGLFSLSPAGVNYIPIIATYNQRQVFGLAGDIQVVPLKVNPEIGQENTLEMEPYNSILYVNNGDLQSRPDSFGLAELGYPSPWAGVLSELIQKNGNFPSRRFE